MNQNQDLDQMLENFLSDNHIADDSQSLQFTKNVMTALPESPRLLWVQDIYPFLGLLMGALVFWKVDIVTPQQLYIWSQKLAVITHINVQTVSVHLNMGVLVGLGLIAGYYAYEKLVEEL